MRLSIKKLFSYKGILGIFFFQKATFSKKTKNQEKLPIHKTNIVILILLYILFNDFCVILSFYIYYVCTVSKKFSSTYPAHFSSVIFYSAKI